MVELKVVAAIRDICSRRLPFNPDLQVDEFKGVDHLRNRKSAEPAKNWQSSVLCYTYSCAFVIFRPELFSVPHVDAS